MHSYLHIEEIPTEEMKTEYLRTDLLIIGGGAAGCYAALTIAEHAPDTSVIIAEKANIKRSGCLAAGVNALNAYITKGHTPDFYVDYAVRDAHGIAREDLLLSMSENLNEVTKKLEQIGLVILKDSDGEYVSRGNRNIKINGENIKPILANAVGQHEQIIVKNNLNIVDYMLENNRVTGAYGHYVTEEKLAFISAKAVLVATGGAAGLYQPNHPEFSRHKMWYCPFNTGAGYAMGIRAGAEMTTFEMRFIALRCKDTIAPTGTLAQGVGAKQINARGEVYEDQYGWTTSQRVWGTVAEIQAGRGPCYLKTEGITNQQAKDLEKAYLNMAPSQTLKWIARGKSADDENVEIEGTEPYVVGGHTASGYWVNNDRKTTLDGLYAAGDVAGGCPQKYVTGALAEGKIAALAALEDIKNRDVPEVSERVVQEFASMVKNHLQKLPAHHISSRTSDLSDTKPNALFTAEMLEIQMQKIMDRYAGGISQNYAFSDASLVIAEQKIAELAKQLDQVVCCDMQDLTHFFEVRERMDVCRTLIVHLKARKETRWHCFAENLSFPEQDDAHFLKYINSKTVNGEIQIITRELAPRRGYYEYNN